MKILNRFKVSGFGTQASLLKPANRLTLARQATVPEHQVPSDATRPRDEKINRRTLRIQNFSYHSPAAKNVQLVGDFTGWLQRPINLQKGSEGAWWKAIRLEVGTHQYRFLVDGKWQDDPECSHFVPNPFGSRNAVRQVH
jgi:1,4-alpha-glucan branching enzyme